MPIWLPKYKVSAILWKSAAVKRHLNSCAPREQYFMCSSTLVLAAVIRAPTDKTAYPVSSLGRAKDGGYGMNRWGRWGLEKLRVTEMEQMQRSNPQIKTKMFFITFLLIKQLVNKYIAWPDAGFGSQVTLRAEKARRFDNSFYTSPARILFRANFSKVTIFVQVSSKE